MDDKSLEGGIWSGIFLGVDVLVFCDNEGCIVEGKGAPFDLPAMMELAKMIKASSLEFSICTGRPVPYIEAITQMLHLLDSKTEFVCEAGAVLYDPQTDHYEVLSDRVDVTTIRSLLPPAGYREELGKIASYSVYPESPYTVERLYELLISAGLSGVNLTRSVAAVDITAAGVDKAFGIEVILERRGMDWTGVLAIGDSWNDLPMLRLAGRSACPANATWEVKAVVDYVSPYPATAGVVDILRWAGAA
ncbi:HAD family hydrolase [Actinocrispum wychmicini]|uniref:Hydroxymethylpyrimidine pyrophosphatase-like HAD family hydrolase n=1 Tax=Actinocrispum wychmicini TaxID=1213861 RepID=A0A4R2ILI4_9PSEU|nr:HAD family hydrolase [Actinocrispum wychmicini]TCO45853.1 hydroxymethylpyrimidine pyrophosphatase-like HAD family hydrolase [Actinocrispum wychmicini]